MTKEQEQSIRARFDNNDEFFPYSDVEMLLQWVDNARKACVKAAQESLDEDGYKTAVWIGEELGLSQQEIDA